MSSNVLQTLLNSVHDDQEYAKKASRLQSLILHATGREISALPASIRARLDVLARTAAALGLDEPSPAAYSAALSKLSSDRLQTELHLITLKSAEKELRRANALANHRRELSASWPQRDDLDADTASLERQRRAMMAKAKEYQDELSAINSASSSEADASLTITSLVALQDKLHQKEKNLKLLKARLSAFEGLPPNLDLAKQELRIARENQIRLMNIREKLLGRMTLGLN